MTTPSHRCIGPVAAAGGGLLLALFVFFASGSGRYPEPPFAGATTHTVDGDLAFEWHRWPSGTLGAEALAQGDWVIAFTAEGCVPCERPYPWLRDAARTMRVVLVVLGDSLDAARRGAAAIQRDWPAEWTVVVTTHDEARAAFGLGGLPAVLAARAGRFYDVPPSIWAMHVDGAERVRGGRGAP